MALGTNKEPRILVLVSVKIKVNPNRIVKGIGKANGNSNEGLEEVEVGTVSGLKHVRGTGSV